MGYGKDDELAINTIRVLAVSEAPLYTLYTICPQSNCISRFTQDFPASKSTNRILRTLC